MENYFRITAYHPAKNICAIFDSNGRFEKLWQFSSYLVRKGFKIVEVGTDDKFLDGNIQKSPAGNYLICTRPAPNSTEIRKSGTVRSAASPRTCLAIAARIPKRVFSVL